MKVRDGGGQGVVDGLAVEAVRRGHGRERGLARVQRFVDQRLAVEMQHVEEERPQRGVTAHRVLELQRVALLVQPQRLAVALARGLAQAGAAVVLNGRDEKKLTAAAEAANSDEEKVAAQCALLADRFRVYFLYPAILAAWSLMGMIAGWSQGFTELLICRTLLGFFEAGHWPCALKTTFAVLNEKDRTMGNSVLQSGASIGAIITPLIMTGLMTAELGSWRTAFQVVGMVGFAWLVLWFALVKKSDLPAPVRLSTNEVEPASESLWSIIFSRRMLVVFFVIVGTIHQQHLFACDHQSAGAGSIRVGQGPCRASRSAIPAPRRARPVASRMTPASRLMAWRRVCSAASGRSGRGRDNEPAAPCDPASGPAPSAQSLEPAFQR